MDLLLIRHGKAFERDAERWPNDDERPLTEEGMRELRSIAKALLRLDIRFDDLVTSPLVRARQTAAIIARAYEWKEAPQESDALGHDCTSQRVIQLAGKFPLRATVAMVGHEPALSRVTAELIGRAGDARIALKKSGVAGIHFEGAAAAGAGTLEFLLRPGHLRKR